MIDDIPNSELERLIDEWVKSDRNRKILKKRLIDGIHYEKIAEEFELSDRQIKTIVKKEKENILLHETTKKSIAYVLY